MKGTLFLHIPILEEKHHHLFKQYLGPLTIPSNLMIKKLVLRKKLVLSTQQSREIWEGSLMSNSALISHLDTQVRISSQGFLLVCSNLSLKRFILFISETACGGHSDSGFSSVKWSRLEKEVHEGKPEGTGVEPRTSETQREPKASARICAISTSHSLEASSSKQKKLSEVIIKETKARQRKVLN